MMVYLYNYRTRSWPWKKKGHDIKDADGREKANPSRRGLMKAGNGSEASLSSSDTGYCEEVMENHDNLRAESEAQGAHRVQIEADEQGRRSRPSSGRVSFQTRSRPSSISNPPPDFREMTPDIIASAEAREPPAQKRSWNPLAAINFPLLRPVRSEDVPEPSGSHFGISGRRQDRARGVPPVEDAQVSVSGGFLRTLSGLPSWFGSRIGGRGRSPEPEPSVAVLEQDQPSPDPEIKQDPMIAAGAEEGRKRRRRKAARADKDSNRDIEVEVVRSPGGTNSVRKKSRRASGGRGVAEV